jgi:hypothetical protein
LHLPPRKQTYLKGKDQMQNTKMISSAKSVRQTDPEDYDLVILGGPLRVAG